MDQKNEGSIILQLKYIFITTRFNESKKLSKIMCAYEKYYILYYNIIKQKQKFC